MIILSGLCCPAGQSKFMLVKQIECWDCGIVERKNPAGALTRQFHFYRTAEAHQNRIEMIDLSVVSPITLTNRR